MAEKKKGFDLASKLQEVSNLDIGIEGREQIEYIDIDRLHQDERNFYELPGIPELAANIEFAGLQQPLRVRPDSEREGHYIIVSGHRRHAALSQLVQEGNEKFRQVACIVEKRSGATDEVEGWLQELRLIYGNSDTRRMSSADISKQAERVEELLYQLKEAGVEFPGKMRDHVAEACKVSASKLARLKVIRENLDGEMKEQWEAGKLNESTAYALAKLPQEHRALVWGKRGQNNWNWNGTQAVKTFGKRLAMIDATEVPDACPVGTCANLDGRRERSLTQTSVYSAVCRCERCCHECPEIATCKYACTFLANEIAEAKRARKEEKAKQKARDEELERPVVEDLTRLWRRFGEARQVGHVSLDELYKMDNFYPRPVESDYLPKERGTEKLKSNDHPPFGYSITLSEIRLLCGIADKMGVSLDYLLCRTDDPREVREIKKEVREWRSRGETPPEGEIIITYGLTNDGPKYTPAVWDGRRFHAPGKPDKELTGLGQQFTKWTLLPEGE